MRDSTHRPVVVKIHGDAQLSPKNLEDDIRKLPSNVKTAMERVLNDRGLLVAGYAGADESFADLITSLSGAALHHGFYWINENPPANDKVFEWMKQNSQAYWVKHTDFDALIAQLFTVFSLEHALKPERFKKIEHKYQEGAKRFLDSYQTDNPEEQDNVDTVSTAIQEKLLLSAAYSEQDIDQRQRLLEKAVKMFPNSAACLGNYANFLCDHRHDFDKAEPFYLRAIEAAPAHKVYRENYAECCFLQENRDKALDLIADVDRVSSEFLRICFSDTSCLNTKALESRLAKGETNPEWNFGAILAKLEAEQAPNLDQLKELAKRVNGVAE